MGRMSSFLSCHLPIDISHFQCRKSVRLVSVCLVALEFSYLCSLSSCVTRPAETWKLTSDWLLTSKQCSIGKERKWVGRRGHEEDCYCALFKLFLILILNSWWGSTKWIADAWSGPMLMNWEWLTSCKGSLSAWISSYSVNRTIPILTCLRAGELTTASPGAKGRDKFLMKL